MPDHLRPYRLEPLIAMCHPEADGKGLEKRIRANGRRRVTAEGTDGGSAARGRNKDGDAQGRSAHAVSCSRG